MRRRRLINWLIGKKHERLTVILGLGLILAYVVGSALLSSLPEDAKRQLLGLRLQRLGAGGMALLLLLCLLHQNLYGSSRFLDQFGHTDRLPKKQMEQVLSVSMTVLLAIGAAVMAGAAWLAPPLTRVMKQIFRPRAALPEAIPQEQATNAVGGPPDLSALFGSGRPAPAWLRLLEQLLILLFWLATVLFFLVMARYLLNRLWAWVTRPRHWDDDERIYLRPSLLRLRNDEEKGPERESLSSRAARFLRPSTYSERIRRYYRNAILQGMKQTTPANPAFSPDRAPRSNGTFPPGWASPSELEQAANCQDPLLHRLYEKARYGPEECTREEYRALFDAQKAGAVPGPPSVNH